jgi:hypothetical protein
MDVCLLCLYVVLSCVGTGLCDGLITRPEESYRVSLCVWLRNLKGGGQGPSWAVEPLDGWYQYCSTNTVISVLFYKQSQKSVMNEDKLFLHTCDRVLFKRLGTVFVCSLMRLAARSLQTVGYGNEAAKADYWKVPDKYRARTEDNFEVTSLDPRWQKPGILLNVDKWFKWILCSV